MEDIDFLKLTVMSTLMFTFGAFGFIVGMFPGGVRWHFRLITGRWGYILSLMYVLANGPAMLAGFIILFMPQTAAANWLQTPLARLDEVSPYIIIGVFWGVLVLVAHILSLMVPDESPKPVRDERKPLHELDHDDLKSM